MGFPAVVAGFGYTGRTALLILTLAALLCALVTATVGPLAFTGMIAPHMAALCGAQKVKSQLIFSGQAGAVLMICADWPGQTLI